MSSRSGIVIVGAGATARALGVILNRSDDIRIIDSNADHCAAAEADGLTVTKGNALHQDVLCEAGAATAECLIAATPNAEVNALTAQLARNEFEVPDVHVLRGEDEIGHAAVLDHLNVTTLFAGPVVITDWDYWIQHERVERAGLNLERLLAPSALYKELQTWQTTVPLAIRRDDRYLPYHGGSKLQKDDRVIVLRARDVLPGRFDRFDRLVARCPVLDLGREHSIDAFFELAAAALSEELNLTPGALMKRFIHRETTSSTVIAPGLAIPHVLVKEKGHFHVLMARCREGIAFPNQPETVHTVFMLVRSRDEGNFYLRALAAIAQTVQDPAFEVKWLQAGGPEDLRTIVLQSERRRFLEHHHQNHELRRQDT